MIDLSASSLSSTQLSNEQGNQGFLVWRDHTSRYLSYYFLLWHGFSSAFVRRLPCDKSSLSYFHCPLAIGLGLVVGSHLWFLWTVRKVRNSALIHARNVMKLNLIVAHRFWVSLQFLLFYVVERTILNYRQSFTTLSVEFRSWLYFEVGSEIGGAVGTTISHIGFPLRSIISLDFYALSYFRVLSFSSTLSRSWLLLLSTTILELSFVVIYVSTSAQNCSFVLFEPLYVLLESIWISLHKNTLD
jgi:hypothetical protein